MLVDPIVIDRKLIRYQRPRFDIKDNFHEMLWNFGIWAGGMNHTVWLPGYTFTLSCFSVIFNFYPFFGTNVFWRLYIRFCLKTDIMVYIFHIDKKIISVIVNFYPFLLSVFIFWLIRFLFLVKNLWLLQRGGIVQSSVLLNKPI